MIGLEMREFSDEETSKFQAPTFTEDEIKQYVEDREIMTGMFFPSIQPSRATLVQKCSMSIFYHTYINKPAVEYCRFVKVSVKKIYR